VSTMMLLSFVKYSVDEQMVVEFIIISCLWSYCNKS